MTNADRIYQYLKECSRESIEQFDDLLDQAEQGGVFSAEDIGPLCDTLFLVERELEDESSYNIDWTIKDRITELALLLALADPSEAAFAAIARAVGRFRTLPRPYLESAVETILTVLLLVGVPGQGESEIAENRALFLRSLDHEVPDHREILQDFCRSNLEDAPDGTPPPPLQKLKALLLEMQERETR